MAETTDSFGTTLVSFKTELATREYNALLPESRTPESPMFERWLHTQARSAGFSPSATTSLAVHAVLIGVWVSGSGSPVQWNPESPVARVFYHPPPERTPAQTGQRETLQFVKLAPEGAGAGLGPAVAEPARAFDEPAPLEIGNLGEHAIGALELAELFGEDSVFTVLEVDVEVSRMENSAAPAYPPALLEQGIEGSVAARYVVDTTGFADPATLRIVRATNADFIAAVSAALPYMRFSPARVGEQKVRQLVEQDFTFRIQPPATARRSRP